MKCRVADGGDAVRDVEKMEARARLRNEMADSARRRIAERKAMIENMADIGEFEDEYE